MLESLGARINSVQYLPVLAGEPGVAVQAVLPILKLPALGALLPLNHAFVSPEPRIPFVVIGPSPSPRIKTEPKHQSANGGTRVTFTAAVTGNPTPTVQWQVSSDGGEIFTNILGATSTTLTFTAIAGDNGNEYRAVFSSQYGQMSTTAATIEVHEDAPSNTRPGSNRWQ